MTRSRRSPSDPTYGRWNLPVKDLELEMDKDDTIQTRRRRVYMSKTWAQSGGHRIDGDDVELNPGEATNSLCDHWLYYKTLESTTPTATVAKGRNVDVLYVHGYSVYGGTLAYDARFALEQGFRVHLIDMPSHGRSTGLFAYIPEVKMLPDAVHAVIADVAHCDKDAGEVERDFFLTGMSLGGLTVLLASLPHARDAAPRFYARLLGTYALCPVIGMVDPPPPTAVIVIVQALSKYVGKKAVFSPTKNGVDNVSDSPEMWQAMINDPMVYSGNMRLASAMAFVGGMSTMNSNASNLRSPVRIVHGERDRNTSHIASSRFIERCGSKDSSYRSFPVEHAMVRVINGKVLESDRAANEAVLDDWLKWMLNRVPRP